MNHTKPIPISNIHSIPYWEQVQNKKISIPSCRACGNYVFYPKAWCPQCMGDEFNWELMSGRGKVETFTIVYQAPYESYRDEVPYVLAVIHLEEGVQMMANVVDVNPNRVHIEMSGEGDF